MDSWQWVVNGAAPVLLLKGVQDQALVRTRVNGTFDVLNRGREPLPGWAHLRPAAGRRRVSGRVRHEYGPGLKKLIDNEAGDFSYIEPGVPHVVFNLSDTEPVVAVVARSDADEWEHIIPYDRNCDGR